MRARTLESDVQIHAMGIHDNPGSKEEIGGPLFSGSLAKLTGGIHATVRSLNDLRPARRALLTDQFVEPQALHHHRLIAFRSDRHAADFDLGLLR